MKTLIRLISAPTTLVKSGAVKFVGSAVLAAKAKYIDKKTGEEREGDKEQIVDVLISTKDGAGADAATDVGLQADLMAYAKGDTLLVEMTKLLNVDPKIGKDGKPYPDITFSGKVVRKIERKTAA